MRDLNMVFLKNKQIKLLEKENIEENFETKQME